ncbi:hypothetical protein DFP73DRAFT_564124 [Morchella snyderi]|nr:hypothetical protein DFP73DRAFT_564124 [Morchella snyderi]
MSSSILLLFSRIFSFSFFASEILSSVFFNISSVSIFIRALFFMSCSVSNSNAPIFFSTFFRTSSANLTFPACSANIFFFTPSALSKISFALSFNSSIINLGG